MVFNTRVQIQHYLKNNLKYKYSSTLLNTTVFTIVLSVQYVHMYQVLEYGNIVNIAVVLLAMLELPVVQVIVIMRLGSSCGHTLPRVLWHRRREPTS